MPPAAAQMGFDPNVQRWFSAGRYRNMPNVLQQHGHPTTMDYASVSGAWAKLREADAGRDKAFLPLHHHAADVAAVFEALLRLPTFARRLARLAGIDALSEADRRRLTLHVEIGSASWRERVGKYV